MTTTSDRHQDSGAAPMSAERKKALAAERKRDEAQALQDHEDETRARRAKSARLRELRLAAEAEETQPEPKALDARRKSKRAKTFTAF